MLKKILAGITAVLTLGCTNALNAVAMSETEMVTQFNCQNVINVSALATEFELPDTDPTHNENYIRELETIEAGSKAMPELIESLKPSVPYYYETELVNVYAKKVVLSENKASLYDAISLTFEFEFPAQTNISLTDKNIDITALEENINEFVGSEKVSVSVNDNIDNQTKIIMTFNNELSPEEINDISVKTADMLNESYQISEFYEAFKKRRFETWDLYYNQSFMLPNTLVRLTAEDARKAGVKGEFNSSTGEIIHDDGISIEDIVNNFIKVKELTGYGIPLMSSDMEMIPYFTIVNFTPKYKIPDEIKERMREKQTEIPVVINCNGINFDNINEEYANEVNEYRQVMSSKSNYTAEEKQKLIENFKTETWNNLVSYERESLVKRTAKKLGLSSDDIAYSIEESKISCCLSYEQIDDLAAGNYMKSIRMIRKDEDFDSENQAYYDKFSPVEGDANGDRNLSISDAVCILQYLANSEKYPISSYLAVNADISDTDGITAHDAAVIQQIDAATR